MSYPNEWSVAFSASGVYFIIPGSGSRRQRTGQKREVGVVYTRKLAVIVMDVPDGSLPNRAVADLDAAPESE
jgi:hypothetical protein